MFPLAGLFVVGFVGLAALTALLSIAYPVFVVWMIVDGALRSDAEYPGTQVNRKVLWVVLMVLVHPVAIVYFFMVFSRVRRGSPAAPCPAPAPVA
jgi:hypothetical protein